MTETDFVIPVTEDELEHLLTSVGVSMTDQKMGEEELEEHMELAKRLYVLHMKNQGPITKKRARERFEKEWKPEILDMRYKR